MGEPVLQKQVVETIARLIGRPDFARELAAIPSFTDTPAAVPDVARLRSTVFMPKHTLDDGLKLTIEWWRNNKNDRHA